MERFTKNQIVEAMLTNAIYGDDGFGRKGKFEEGDKVVDRGDNPGVVVKCYVTINDQGFGVSYRNPAYRVLFVDGKVRTRHSCDLKIV